MHIPDGFLSTPVWVSLDVVAVPAMGYMARRAQRGMEQSNIPLLGVMGAFVFAAQMINFPVGPGASAHLLGGALLAFTLGPAAAAVTMAAILAIQALVFQDGGILALGPNIVNMAILGVSVGYLPFYLWGAGRWRQAAMFAGGFLSALLAGAFAIAELLVSGVRLAPSVVAVSLALFTAAAILEGAITVAVVEALERIRPSLVRSPKEGRRPALAAIALAAALLGTVGALFASAAPDGIQRLGLEAGLASRARTLIATPFSNYEAQFLPAGWESKAAAGLIGLALVFAACLIMGRIAARRRSA